MNYLDSIGVGASESCIKTYRITGEKQLGVRVGEIPLDKRKDVLSKVNEIAGEDFNYSVKDSILYFEPKQQFSVGCGGDG